ncbi:unnamed protein product, partial [Lampetra fluviatilis]
VAPLHVESAHGTTSTVRAPASQTHLRDDHDDGEGGEDGDDGGDGEDGDGRGAADRPRGVSPGGRVGRRRESPLGGRRHDSIRGGRSQRTARAGGTTGLGHDGTALEYAVSVPGVVLRPRVRLGAQRGWAGQRGREPLPRVDRVAQRDGGGARLLVWATAEEVGCGSHLCPTVKNLDVKNAHVFVCNYLPSGNFEDERPYRVGAPCSKCSGKCRNKLCCEWGAQSRGGHAVTWGAQSRGGTEL